MVPCRPALAAPGGRHTVDVLVPEAQSLQLLAFWVALGGGYFAREGLDVRVVLPDSPAHLRSSFAGGGAPVAVLGGPDYERLMADGFPLVLVANLLQNNPLVLVMRHEVATRMGLHERLPVRRRLDALRSVSASRLRTARASPSSSTRRGSTRTSPRSSSARGDRSSSKASRRETSSSFTPRRRDLERALVDDDGVVLVDPAGGEIEKFSERMIEALAVTRAFTSAHPEDVQRLVRALARAERAIHHEPALAMKAILSALPKLDAKHVAKLVSLYSRAVPPTPHVEAQLVKREAAFYPAGGQPLDLSSVNLEAFLFAGSEVLPGAKDAGIPVGAAPRGSFVVVAALVLALAIAAVFLFLDQRDEPKDLSRGAAA